MHRWIVGFLFSAVAFTGAAQRPAIPDTYGWRNGADYKADSSFVYSCLEHLCIPGSHTDPQWWSAANAYVMSWLSGSPQVRLEINSKALPFIETHEELIFPFVHGMALSHLKNPNEKNQVKLMADGLRQVVVFAEGDEVLRKDRAVRSIVRADRRNKLEEFVKQRIQNTDKH